MAKKVLVVDDEKLIVKGIRFSLEQDDMEVDCTYDGEEALRQLADEVVREHFGPLIVTPKEIDALIGDTAEMLADGINRMLQRECFAELKALFG